MSWLAPITTVLTGNTVNIPSGNVVDFETQPTDARAEVFFNRDGTVTSDPVGDINSTWISPNSSTVGDNYEIYVADSGADVPTGTLDTWVALSSNQSWYLLETGVGTQSCTLTISIRRTGGSTLDTNTINLDATVDSGV